MIKRLWVQIRPSPGLFFLLLSFLFVDFPRKAAVHLHFSQQAINQTLGSICQTFPAKMKKYSRNVKHVLIAQLDEQTKAKTSKLDLTVVEGCFQGLTLSLEVRATHIGLIWT